MSISEEKSALRQALRRRLAQSDPTDNAACDVAITMQVLALPEFQAAERIFAYCSVVPEPGCRRSGRPSRSYADEAEMSSFP